MVSRSMQSELCLQLAIDEFVRVQLWRVRREEKELNFILVFFAPSLNEFRMVYAAVVANDEQLATRFAILLNKAMKKSNEVVAANCTGLKTEIRQSLVVHS